MVLATTIAAIGLVQDSAAVVIGAMLVAPLMTPLLGLGLALVQGNVMLASTLTFWMVGFRSFRKSSRWIINTGIIVMVSVVVLVILLLSL